MYDQQGVKQYIMISFLYYFRFKLFAFYFKFLTSYFHTNETQLMLSKNIFKIKVKATNFTRAIKLGLGGGGFQEEKSDIF